MNVVLSEKNIIADVTSSVEKNFDAASPFFNLRKDALNNFQRLGLPGTKTEEYKHTPITRILDKNFSFSLINAADTDSVNIEAIKIPDITGNVLVFINGSYSHQHSKIVSPESSVSILPMTDAIEMHKEIVLQHLGKIADYSTDPFTAWNTAAWKTGVFVHVTDNKIIEEPVLIYHIHDAQNGQVVTASRNLIVVGKSSELTLVEKFDSIGGGNGFSTSVSEAIVGENGGLSWFTIQNDAGNRYQFEHKQIHQTTSSRVNTFTFTLDGKFVRNNLLLSLDGEGIDSHMYGLYLIAKDTLADNHTVVDHRQPNSFSNELYKGIIEESAKGVFNGKIYVRPNAQKTNAFQANRNILLGDKASVNTKPQLEIWADDVKCSHGCTSGQLDEEALFYLRARGISKETARAMMLYAFAGELLETIKNKSLRTYLDSLISERLHKNF
jgi:Fe-S cluster assembly protein SufD